MDVVIAIPIIFFYIVFEEIAKIEADLLPKLKNAHCDSEGPPNDEGKGTALPLKWPVHAL